MLTPVTPSASWINLKDVDRYQPQPNTTKGEPYACCPGCHDDVIKWEHFPRYWPFMRGIHRSPLNSPHKGQWRGSLMFSLICAWINGWVNNREVGDLRRHRARYNVIVMRHMCPIGILTSSFECKKLFHMWNLPNCQSPDCPRWRHWVSNIFVIAGTEMACHLFDVNPLCSLVMVFIVIKTD